MKTSLAVAAGHLELSCLSRVTEATCGPVLIFKNMVTEVKPPNRINSAALTHLGHSTGLPSPLCNCIARAFDRFRGGSRGDGCTHRSGRPASPAGKHIPGETCRNRAPHCNQPRIWLMGGGGKGERRGERERRMRGWRGESSKRTGRDEEERADAERREGQGGERGREDRGKEKAEKRVKQEEK